LMVPVQHGAPGEMLMVRIMAAALLALSVSACAISPPTSMFSSLGNDDDKAETPREEARPVQPKPERQQQAGVGGSISSAWDSVKSGLGFGAKETKVSLTEKESVDPAEVQELINTYRVKNGLKPLQLNPKLSDAALTHSKDLAKSDRISHFGSDGSDTWDRVRRTGYKARVTAENVGTGQQSLSEVFRGWQRSRDHNANLLLADAEEMGIAVVHDPDTRFKTFWTLVVGAPLVR
jgi:uncharacterized protein YkwD